MGIVEQIEVESLVTPAHGGIRQDEVISIKPDYRQGTRFYTCPFCASSKFFNSFKLRKHMTEEHPDKRILVLDHPQLEAVASSDIQLGEHTQEGGDTGKRSLNLQSGQTVLSYPRKRQKRVIFEPSDGGFHRFVSAEENVDDPLSMESDSNQVTNQEDQPPVHNVLVHGREHCGVCCLEVETDQAGHVDQLQVAGQTYRAIINVSLGFEVSPGSNVVCTECENLTTSIGHTRIELLRLQKKLNEAVSRLRDLYQRGQALLEADLEEGGLTERSTCVRIVHDLTQPQRELRNLGFTLGRSFHGCIVNKKNTKEDDGSQVKSLNLNESRCQQEEVSCLFLTQEEWASSGLTVWDGQVQVPDSLVAGAAIGATRPKFLLSQGVCTDLGQHTYLCLDCDASFNRLTELLSHTEGHDPEFRRQNVHDDNIYMGHQLSPSATQDIQSHLFIKENEETECNTEETDSLLRINQKLKLTKARMNHQEATEQECENEVPSLDKPFQCGECNKCFESAMELWGHQFHFFPLSSSPSNNNTPQQKVENKITQPE